MQTLICLGLALLFSVPAFADKLTLYVSKRSKPLDAFDGQFDEEVRGPETIEIATDGTAVIQGVKLSVEQVKRLQAISGRLNRVTKQNKLSLGFAEGRADASSAVPTVRLPLTPGDAPEIGVWYYSDYAPTREYRSSLLGSNSVGGVVVRWAKASGFLRIASDAAVEAIKPPQNALVGGAKNICRGFSNLFAQ